MDACVGSLKSDSHHVFIWRTPETRYNLEKVVEHHRYGGTGLLVLGDIILVSRTVHHVQNRTMAGRIYWENTLQYYVHVFCGAMGVNFIFVGDNIRFHHSMVGKCV